jgi:hypothetical protein
MGESRGSQHRRRCRRTPINTELPERSSVQRKSELVLRLLPSEVLDAVLRESLVPAH